MTRSLQLLLAVVLASLTIGAGAADAATARTHVFGCSKSGFTGTFKYETTAKGHLAWFYKIAKGKNNGGNHANVNIYDGGTAPATRWNSPDSMRQDGKYHSYPTHARGSGAFEVTFIFDKSGADPRCTAVFDGAWPS